MFKVFPMSVVLAEYKNLQGAVTTGLFLVIYNEDLDSEEYNCKNCVGLKITSQDIYANKYRYKLFKDKCTFLERDSFVYCNKPTTLLLSNCKVLGFIPKCFGVEIYNRWLDFITASQHQISQSLYARR